MANYTIKNVKDVEDSAPKFGLSPNVEARFARDDLDAEQLGVSYQRYAPNFRHVFGHRHKTHEEIYAVVGGSGRIKLDDDVVDVKQWDVVRVAPETVRCWEAGPDGLEIIAFGPKFTDPNEGEMLQGWWSD